MLILSIIQALVYSNFLSAVFYWRKHILYFTWFKTLKTVNTYVKLMDLILEKFTQSLSMKKLDNFLLSTLSIKLFPFYA